VASQFVAEGAGARVLPDNGVGVGLARAPVPDQRRLALIGHSHRGNVRCLGAGFVERFVDDLLRALPDFHCVMLDPARLRKNLGVFELMNAHRLAPVVEQHAAGAGGALIDGGNVTGHV
jgi:hypothetical protein